MQVLHRVPGELRRHAGAGRNGGFRPGESDKSDSLPGTVKAQPDAADGAEVLGRLDGAAKHKGAVKRGKTGRTDLHQGRRDMEPPPCSPVDICRWHQILQAKGSRRSKVGHARRERTEWAVGYDPPTVEHHDPIGMNCRLIERVGHFDHGETEVPPERRQLEPACGSRRGVEGRKRFVKEQEIRSCSKSAGDRDPLLLSARERRRPAPGEMDASEPFEYGLCLLSAFAPTGATHPEAERDVLESREMREETVVLEDETDPPLLGRKVPGILAAEKYRARLGADQPRDGPEQERLPGPGRANQQAVLAGGDLESIELEDELADPDPTPLTSEHRASRAVLRPCGAARGLYRRQRGVRQRSRRFPKGRTA